MINRHHSAESNNFIFKTCMKSDSMIQKDFTKQFLGNQANGTRHFNQKYSRPISRQDLEIAKFRQKKLKQPASYRNQSHNYQQQNLFVDRINFEKQQQPINRLQRNTDNSNMKQSRQSRNSRNSGQKIKILSIQHRDKAFSRQSNVSSQSQQKRGIGITKTLLKKISGMYNDKDFNRSNASSTHKYRKQFTKDLQTTGIVGTTWDGQRTANQEYQLSQFQTTNNRMSFDNFGFVSTYNVLNGLNESTRIAPPRNSFGYSNEGIQFSQQLKNIYMDNSSPYRTSFHENYYQSNPHIQQNNSSRHYNQGLSYQTQHVLPKPTKKHKINFIKSQDKNFKYQSPISKETMMFKHKSPQMRKSFAKVTTISRQVSDIKIGMDSKLKPGEQLTHMLYGNKNMQQSQQKLKNEEQRQRQRQKYVLKYKNKTLQQLPLIQSTVSGYGDYYL